MTNGIRLSHFVCVCVCAHALSVSICVCKLMGILSVCVCVCVFKLIAISSIANTSFMLGQRGRLLHV